MTGVPSIHVLTCIQAKECLVPSDNVRLLLVIRRQYFLVPYLDHIKMLGYVHIPLGCPHVCFGWIFNSKILAGIIYLCYVERGKRGREIYKKVISHVDD